MTNRLRFAVAKDEEIPTVGTTICVPVDAGADWFELGIFENAHWRSDGHVEFVIRLHPHLRNIALDSP